MLLQLLLAFPLAIAGLQQPAPKPEPKPKGRTPSTSGSSPPSSSRRGVDRRGFGDALLKSGSSAAAAAASCLLLPEGARAQVFFDPAMYGDQELRVGAVDSVRESVRRAILKDPQIAPSFYQLALLDGLSYNAATGEYGPDGSVLKLVFSSKDDSSYTKNLQAAGAALLDAEKALRQKNAISVPDAIAIAGAEAIESVGGPVLTVQLGRMDTPKAGPVNANLPIDLLSGRRSAGDVVAAFRSAGMTEREMTALLGGLMTLEIVEKSRSVDDWRESSRPKFREAGRLGRMSEFRPLTDDDLAEAELRADPDYEDPDDGWYIADSFGSRETRFGERLGKDDLSEKTFNRYLQELAEANRKRGDLGKFGWVGALVVDPNVPTAQTWLQKYASSNLNYVKDLNGSFNAVTQLGAVYTGGKYENLLKNRPRKSLNNDDLKLF